MGQRMCPGDKAGVFEGLGPSFRAEDRIARASWEHRAGRKVCLEKPFFLDRGIRRLMWGHWRTDIHRMAFRAHGPVVLVVDDEPTIRDLFARTLAFDGYVPVEAATAEQALGLLNQGLRPDAVLLDLQMPGMGGLSFLLRLRAHPQLSEIPVGIVTGDTSLPSATRSAAAALRAELQFKPLIAEEILDLTKRLLERFDG